VGATIGEVGLRGSSVAVALCSTPFFYMNDTQQKLLDQKIIDLPLEDSLKSVLINSNIFILRDLLDMDVANWRKVIFRFNFHHQHEILEYLEKNNLTEFLKEE
jgi:hypothetical protein